MRRDRAHSRSKTKKSRDTDAIITRTDSVLLSGPGSKRKSLRAKKPNSNSRAELLSKAPEVVQRVWQVADQLGYGQVFAPRAGEALTDDHVPLQQAGIHAIDVIDFTFPYHHTTEDTIDKVSAQSLQIVGDVAVALVRQ